MRTRSVGKSWRKLLGSQQAPAGLTLVTECPPLPQGGTEAIAQWLDRNPDARMVVIDVFAKMRGQAPQGVSAYNADDVPVGYAKRLADHYGIAVVMVHHVRKAGSDDFLTEVSGTNGIAGAADATLVLKRARGQADGILHVTGRDVDEAEYALSFQPASGAWHLLPVSNKKWTDSGKPHDKRGLKAREVNSDRPVPAPPLLVAILRTHIKEFGKAKDGRIFQNERGDVLGTSSYWRVWQEARPIGLPPHRTRRLPRSASGRPTCGIPASPTGHEELNNSKIEKAMGWGEGD